MAIKVRKLSSKKINLVGKLVGIPEIVIDRDERNWLSIIIGTKGQKQFKWNMAIEVRKLSSKKLNLVGKLVGIPEIVIDRDDSVHI